MVRNRKCLDPSVCRGVVRNLYEHGSYDKAVRRAHWAERHGVPLNLNGLPLEAFARFNTGDNVSQDSISPSSIYGRLALAFQSLKDGDYAGAESFLEDEADFVSDESNLARLAILATAAFHSRKLEDALAQLRNMQIIQASSSIAQNIENNLDLIEEFADFERRAPDLAAQSTSVDDLEALPVAPLLNEVPAMKKARLRMVSKKKPSSSKSIASEKRRPNGVSKPLPDDKPSAFSPDPYRWRRKSERPGYEPPQVRHRSKAGRKKNARKALQQGGSADLAHLRKLDHSRR